MHDANGTELKKGDRVMIECEVTELYETEDFCNVSLRTVRPMRGDGGTPSDFSAVNTGQLVLLARAPGEPTPKAED